MNRRRGPAGVHRGFLGKRRFSTMYKAETRGISVTVMPRFVEEESSPGESRYFFAYTVEIVP